MDLRITTYGWIIVILVIYTILLSTTEGEFFCFKRVHKMRPKRGSICGGLVNKTSSSGRGRPFRSQRGCCRSGGAGYTEGEMIGALSDRLQISDCLPFYWGPAMTDSLKKRSRSCTETYSQTIEDFGIYQYQCYEPMVRVGKKSTKYTCTPCRSRPRATTHPDTSAATTLRTPVTSDLSTTAKQMGWSDWSACSASCRAGFQRRLCESNSCSGPETKPCMVVPECPINGGWGPWHVWSECSATCGGGNKTRIRACNNPAPMHNGLECPGAAVEARSCNTNSCPVNGNWGDWSESECSKTCGRGLITRTRSCDNPPPSNNGSTCDGVPMESVKCEGIPKCPRHGGWSIWSDWSPCEISCGAGTQLRIRQCNAPPPKHNGNNCSGELSEQQICYTTLPCPVDGGWSDWGGWGQCFALPCTGERGYTTRKRTCKNPQPKFGGALCDGNNTETQGCINNEHCPVNGEWCAWSNFTECRTSDTGNFKIKTRDCGCPTPESGGQPCVGIDFEVVKCEDGEKVSNSRCRRQDGDSPEITESSGFTDDDDC